MSDPSRQAGDGRRRADGADTRGSVTFVITSSSVAGAQRQVRDLAVGLQDRGWRTSVISMLPLEEMFDGLPELGIPTHTLGMARGLPDPRAVRRLRTFLRVLRPDVVHAHMVHAILLARITRLVTPIPVLVGTMHNQRQGGRWRYLAYRVTDRLSDLTTSVSEVAREDAVRLGAAAPGRISVIPNGVDVAGFSRDETVRRRSREALGIDDGEFLWLAAGRLDAAKDYPNMLEAVARLPRELPMRLLVAGTGPLDRELRARIEDMGLVGRVELLGLRTDLKDLMQAADGFVMSSAWEGLPMVLLEAGASSLPMVATDVGGSREAIEEGVSGYIVSVGDPEALAAGMQRLIDRSEAERRVMGAAARRHVEATFDLDVIVDRWDRSYLELLASARAA